MLEKVQSPSLPGKLLSRASSSLFISSFFAAFIPLANLDVGSDAVVLAAPDADGDNNLSPTVRGQ